MVEKLQQWGLKEAEVHQAVLKLEEEKFIDERRYAMAVVNDKFRFGKWGRIKIRHSLRVHGISAEVAGEALGNIDNEAYETMIREQVNSKVKNTRAVNQWDLKAKILRFAQSRGYETELVFRILDSDND